MVDINIHKKKIKSTVYKVCTYGEHTACNGQSLCILRGFPCTNGWPVIHWLSSSGFWSWSLLLVLPWEKQPLGCLEMSTSTRMPFEVLNGLLCTELSNGQLCGGAFGQGLTWHRQRARVCVWDCSEFSSSWWGQSLPWGEIFNPMPGLDHKYSKRSHLLCSPPPLPLLLFTAY